MKNRSGITLIALMITIVVLIILASVAITLSLGDNGIFKKAVKAKEDTLTAQNEEAVELAKTTNTIDEIVSSSNRENNNIEAYSEQEKVIGTWKDGKTLYQKDYYFTSDFDGYDISSLKFDYIAIDLGVSTINLKNSSNLIYSATTYYWSSTDYCDVRIRKTKKTLLLSYGSLYNFSDAYIRLKYTKI